MEAIPLIDGDPSWVFGTGVDVTPLIAAASNVDQLASHFGKHPGWAGTGVEWHRMPNGATTAVGFTESDGADPATFWAELGRDGDRWRIEASIVVRCDGEVDCGEHVIERWPRVDADSPAFAMTAFIDATLWLLQRGSVEKPEHWRHADPETHA